MGQFPRIYFVPRSRLCSSVPSGLGPKGIGRGLMPKKIAMMDYQKCHPEKCDHGLCSAVLECEYESLLREIPYETPEVDISK